MKNDLDIAQRASLLPIVPLARDRLGIPEDQLDSYGRYKAKVSLPFLAGL
ncbi:MAG: formate--tetrahydrofolate ligase, partial [Burkholderiaceae bacterium]|nr:formate--tetrahydrofolate ligase [Burkholderiaceae bacterium]